jgi:hypothetical protein
MPRITAWKCPHTGELFENERLYQNHLARLGRERRREKQRQETQLLEASWWRDFQNREMDVSDLPDAILANQDRFWAAAKKEIHWNIRRRPSNMPQPVLHRFTKFQLHWSNAVSNSHSCPRSGVTNWGGQNSNAPRSYPGWLGQVAWEIVWPKEWDGWYPGSDLFRSTHCGIHITSGGGGGWHKGRQSFEYGVEIFADDWPGLARYREKKQMWQVLSEPNLT